MTQGNVNLKLGLDTSPATANLQQFYRKLNQGGSQAAAAQRPIATSLEKVVASAKKLGLTYDKVNRSFKDSKGAVQTLAQVKKRVDDLNTSLAKTEKVASTALSGIGAGFKQVLQGIPQGIGLAIGQQLLAPLTNFGSVIQGAVGGAVKTFVDIDAALRQTASISGATEAEFEELQNAVIGLAKDTKFTTGELAEASIALARAGFSAQEVQEALPGIAEGAAAAGQGMEQMSDTVIGAMGGFQKSTSETIDVVDVLTATANGSNQSVTDLGEALKYVGPIANGLGLTLEDTSAALGLLANAGIRGSQAGTTLRSGLSRLSAAAAGQNSEFASLSRGTGRLSKTLQMLGADVTNSAGDLKAFPELLKTLKSSLGSLSANEQQLVSKILFGEEAAAGFRALLANSVEDIESFAAATNNATGTAAETSKQNLAGIAGSLTFLSSAFDAASATVGKFLGTFIKPLVDALTAVLNAFNGLPAPIQQAVVAITAIGVAAGIATAAFVLFKAAAAAGLFAGIGTAAAGVATQMGVLAATMSGLVVKAVAATGVAINGLNAALTKNITFTALATKAKLAYAAALAAVKKVSISGIISSIGAAFAKAGVAAKAAAAKLGAFAVGAAPIAAVAAAVGAVALAWNTYNQVQKQANEVSAAAAPIQDDLNEALREQEIAAKGANTELEKLAREWETSVERVGFFDANLDKLRAGLGLTTAETAQLEQGTVALYQEFGAVGEGVDALTGKYREIAASLADSSPEERASKMAQLAAIEASVGKAVSGSIQSLKKQREEFIKAAGSVEDMTDAEKQQLQAFDQLIKSMDLSGKMLAALKNKYVEATDAAKGFNGEVEETPTLEQLEKEVKDASAAFKGQMKAMEESFKNFKAELAAGVKTEVDAIKADIKSLKDESKVFSATKDDEIRALKEINTAQQRANQDAKTSIQRTGEARVSSIRQANDAQQASFDQEVSLLQRAAAATDARYARAKTASQNAHNAVMKNLDAELRAIQKQKQAVNDRYDAVLNGLRDATPAEQQLAALDKYRLEQQAKLGGEEGLRARAALERLQADAMAADVEKQKQAELAKLEEEQARKEEEKRRKEEEHTEKMQKLELERAEEAKKNQEEIDQLKLDAAEKEKENQELIKQAQAETKAAEQQLEDKVQEQKRQHADEVKRLEGEKRADKEATAKKEEELLKRIDAVEEAANLKKTAAEEQYADKRNDMLDKFNVAIGNTSDVIVREGNSAWSTYASNAVQQLARVEAAARRAAQAAATTGSGGGGSRWTGGPVSAGQSYTVNELGQEAFRSSTGKISMIDAPAFGRWKAPSKGSVINAAQTEKLGLPSAGPAVSGGPAIDPTGGVAAQSVNGGETRNLLRAIAKATGGDTIHNNVTIQAANTTQAASDMMVELTKVKRRRLR